MSSSIPPADARRQRLLAETQPRMIKAHLPNAETECWREPVGKAIAKVQSRSGLSLKEFAGAVKRDERQVARWLTGVEHAQLAALFAVPALRLLLIVALAELAGVKVTTHIEIEAA